MVVWSYGHYGKIKAMKRKAQKKEKKENTRKLPYCCPTTFGKSYDIESIKKGVPMGELIAQKLQRLKALIEKTAMTNSSLDF